MATFLGCWRIPSLTENAWNGRARGRAAMVGSTFVSEKFSPTGLAGNWLTRRKFREVFLYFILVITLPV
jgi:hypothetical protein